MSHKELPGERRVAVPYVTAWSGEREPSCQLIERRGAGIGYADEIPTDRDEHGILWYRTLSRPGVGRPLFGDVNSLRQRRAMQRLLCQVCGGPADRNEDGVLWLLRDHREDWTGWPESMGAVEPPVCLPCVSVSVRLCPALRGNAVVVRVREFPIVGVRGALYRGGCSPVAVAHTVLGFDDPAARWIRAVGLVRQLRGCTIGALE